MLRIVIAVMVGVGAALGTASAAEMSMGTGKAATPAAAADDAAMASMMKAMAVKPTGNPDKDFVRMMMPHHQGAVDMAKVELRYGKDPELRALANAIITAQETELAQMKAWLAAH